MCGEHTRFPEIIARNSFFCALISAAPGHSFHLQTDKFALVPNVWNRFVVSCISCYEPGANIKIDEQIFPTKARCRFKHEKPDRFGIKFLLAVDVETNIF